MSFQVGSKVKVVHTNDIRHELYDEEGEVVELAPTHSGVMRAGLRFGVVLPNHKLKDYEPDFVWYFREKEIELLGEQHTIKSTSRKEAPCKNCTRLNDVGVKICWLCGSHP